MAGTQARRFPARETEARAAPGRARGGAPPGPTAAPGPGSSVPRPIRTSELLPANGAGTARPEAAARQAPRRRAAAGCEHGPCHRRGSAATFRRALACLAACWRGRLGPAIAAVPSRTRSTSTARLIPSLDVVQAADLDPKRKQARNSGPIPTRSRTLSPGHP